MSRDEKYSRGCDQARRVIGEKELNKLENDYHATPHLVAYVIENIWGDLFCRQDTLGLREREMVTIAALATLGGCDEPLKVHVNGALNVGVSPAEIAEIITHLAGLAGVPRALGAARAVIEVFQERGLKVE